MSSSDTDRANLTKLRRLVRDAVNRIATDKPSNNYERIWLERAQLVLKETVPSEVKRDPARLYRAGNCPKCGSDNTNLLQNGDGECYPCGFVYEFSEAK